MYADDLEAARFALVHMLKDHTSQERADTRNWYIASL